MNFSIAYHLRHNAALLTEPSGWVELAALAALDPGYTERVVSDIRMTVAKDKKGRFEISGTRIRATNGHSVALLAPVMRALSAGESAAFEWAVHGTTEEAWIAIQASGALKKMSRDYVHFAVDVAHLRPDTKVDVYLYLDAAAMLRDGRELFFASNRVLASVADVPLRYLSPGPRPDGDLFALGW